MTTPELNHRYRLHRLLGQGGQAMVFEASDRFGGAAPMALKVITSPQFAARLRSEFQVAKRLAHPNVAKAYDFGVVGAIEGTADIRIGAPFFTQELIQGTPSDQWASALPVERRLLAVVRVGVQVARALEQIHRVGLIHRDIKPANIIIAQQTDCAKVIDLGLAVSLRALDGLRAGTLAFMAPETLHGFPDARSDIFSLGMTLIALLTGTPRLIEADAAVHDGLPAALPDGVRAVLRRMIAPQADRRFETASDVVLALAKAIGPAVLGEIDTDTVIDAASDTATPAIRAARARSPRLVGREALLEALTDWLSDGNATPPMMPVAVLAGPPGVGKTRLFQAALIAAQLESAGAGTPPFQSFGAPLRALMHILSDAVSPGDALTAWLGGIDRNEARIDTPAGDETLIEEMVQLVNGAVRQPTVLFIDGMTTGLEPRLLGRLAREPRPEHPMCVVLETRDDNVRSQLPEAARFSVSPLSAADETELVTAALGVRPDAETARRIHGLTGGIPALTEAVLAAVLAAHPKGELAPGMLDTLPVTGHPGELLTEALNRLPAPSKQLAAALAVAGIPLKEAEAAAVASIDDSDVLATALSHLEANGCIAFDGDRVVLGRLLAETLLEAMDAQTRRQLCRKMVDVLDARGAPSLQRLSHAVAAGLDEQARVYAEEAYAALRGAGDLRGAAEVLEILLSLISETDVHLDARRVELARLLRMTGQYPEAIARCETVSTASPHADAAALERALALRLIGRTDDALALLDTLSRASDQRLALNAISAAARIELDRGQIEKAAKRFETVTVDALRAAGASPLNTVGLIALFSGKPERARVLFETGLADAREKGDVRSEARFFGLLGMVCHGASDWTRAVAHYRSAHTLAEQAGDRHGAATYAVNLAAALTEQGEFDAALTAYRDGLSRLRRFGRPEEITQAGANYAELLHRLGDLDTADTVSAAALDEGRRTGHRPLAIALRVRGDLLRARGRYDDARVLLDEAAALARQEHMIKEHAVTQLHLAALEIDTGRYDDAFARLEFLREDALVDQPSALLEKHRLEVAVALEGRGDLTTAMDRLGALLPKDPRLRRADHLWGFIFAARGAKALRDASAAREAAVAALDLLKEIRDKTPSLYHETESPMLKEMTALSQLGSVASSPNVGDGDWRRLVRINTRLNSEMRVGRLLETVMDAALDITGAERGFLLIVNAKGELKVRCVRNLDRARSLDDASYSRTVAIRAFASAEPVLTTDAQEDDRFNEMRSVVNLNLRYIVAVPLKVAGTPTGTIYLDSRHGGHFGETRLALLEALADQAAIALTNARLRAEIRRRQSKIEKLNRALTEKLESREGELEAIKGELMRRTDELITRYRYDEIVGRSEPMRAVFHLIDRVVKGDFPVIIQGESGTGKELVARAVHFNGKRKRRPFVVENCAAIPESLLESVLFGHVRGAFTGAVHDTPGLFVEADRGTLFLDEIGDMPLGMQTKLLRVLQNGEVRPVGGSKIRRVDVRIVVATNTDIKEKVKNGDFREDLYYRLNVLRIALPPLRDRKADIPLLIDHFITKYGAAQKTIDKTVIDALTRFHWPGNVRQLENEIHRAAVLSEKCIHLDHLSEEVIAGAEPISDADVDFKLQGQVDRLKQRLIKAAMQKVGNNQTAAAELLGLSRYGLQKMLKRFGM